MAKLAVPQTPIAPDLLGVGVGEALATAWVGRGATATTGVGRSTACVGKTTVGLGRPVGTVVSTGPKSVGSTGSFSWGSTSGSMSSCAWTERMRRAKRQRRRREILVGCFLLTEEKEPRIEIYRFFFWTSLVERRPLATRSFLIQQYYLRIFHVSYCEDDESGEAK
jgi:hypothetical protein